MNIIKEKNMEVKIKNSIGSKLLYGFVLAVVLVVCSCLGLAYQRQSDELALTQAQIDALTASVYESNDMIIDTILAELWNYATITQIEDQVYTGSAITPTVIVSAGSVTFVEGVDYTLSYEDNVNAGTATVTVTGQNGYTGTKTSSFNIIEETVESEFLDFRFDGNVLAEYLGTDTNVTVPSSYSLGPVTVTTLASGSLDYTSQYNSCIDGGMSSEEASAMVENFAQCGEIMMALMDWQNNGYWNVTEEHSNNEGIIIYSIVNSVQNYIEGDDYSVTTISTNAFIDTTAVNITFPSSVTTLNQGALCSNALLSVTLLSTSLISISTGVFFGTNDYGLANVIFSVYSDLLATYQSTYPALTFAEIEV